MQDKIIAAIAAYLEKETHLSSKHGETFAQFMHPIKTGFNRAEYCQEIATEIAEAIAPLVDAGEPELNREKYNKSFLEWLDKYFHREKSKGYRSNTTGVFFTVKELEQRYERANLDKARL